MKKIISMFLCILILGTIIPCAALATKICADKNILNDNSPPEAPTVTAPFEVQRGKFFDVKVVTTDPDGDDVYYKFDINGHDFGWRGEFPSGVEHIEKNLKLSVPAGDYTLGVQAMDIHEAESEWTYVEINVKARSKGIEGINGLLFIKFLEKHPNMFPLLQLLQWL